MVISDRPMTRRGWFAVVGVAAVCGSGLVSVIYLRERWALEAEQARVTFGTGPIDPFLKFRMPGISRPPVVSAARSTLLPEDQVIGLVVAGRARAYRLDALRDRSRHIVNDLIGEVPVSVTFCDLDECVRTYQGRSGQGPLDVSVGGLWQGRQLILEVEGSLYYQRSGDAFAPGPAGSKLSLQPIEPTLTSWSSWQRDHPDTEVYEGIR